MICFAWEGFPQYAARCVGAFVKSTTERVVVLATRPSVPVEGMEAAAGCEVHWVANRQQADVIGILGEYPRYMFTSAWHSPAFSASWGMIREKGNKLVALVDNNYEPTLKCFLNGIRFRMLYRNRFDGFMVPGNSGVRLLRSYGVPEEMISRGMYRADSALFKSKILTEDRPRHILFTGRLIPRKNVIRMCNAFMRANARLRDEEKWVLDICGTGFLESEIPQSRYIVKHGFVQPEEIAEKYQESQCFVLPSLSEHWGVVVHEAALSGCVLLLSDRIGAASDFLTEKNGCVFNPFDERAFETAFTRIMSMTREEIAIAGAESLRVAREEGLAVFVDGIKYFTER